MQEELATPKLRPVERHCPRCNHVMVENAKEECVECPNCGHIDCGDDD